MSRWMAVAAVIAAMAVSNAADAADKVVLQLHGPAQFEFAGYYAALWKGFYKEAGLEVDIKPGAGRGQPPIDAVREVTEGRAQFGTGTADLIIRTAQGLPLVLLAPIFQQSGAAIYYRADSDFASPAALVKGKVGRLPVSDILDIELATALKAEGIDAGKLKSPSLDPGQTVPALADKTVDAAPGSAWDVPFLARDKGLALKSINPADYRVEFYGDGLFSLQRLAKAEPQTVRSFRAASLKGWDYALQHPDEIAGRLVGEVPAPPGIADAAAFARYQAEVARRLSRYPEVGLGHSNPYRWERIEASMVGAGALLRTADTGDFVFDPDGEARSKADFRAFAIIGATLLVGLAVTVWLGLRWRRRPKAAAVPASAPAAAAEAPALAQSPIAPAAAAARVAPPVEDLNALLKPLEGALRRRVPRRINLRLSLLPELWRCQLDPQIVRRHAMELVAAAAADIKGEGELIVGTRNLDIDAARLADTPGAQLGEYARLTVRDNGPGLAEDALERIFEIGATRRPAAAAAAAAMRDLGGFARVESAEGVGTAVHLYFPRLTETAASDEKKAEAAA